MFESVYSAALPSTIACPPDKPTILVVDDVRSIRELLKLHLSNAGYDVVTAEDAIVAGKHVLHNPPGLIITDVVMPYMSGIEFVSALRADETIPDIPMIFLSAREEFGQEQRHLRVAAWLRKPVRAERPTQLRSERGRVAIKRRPFDRIDDI